MCLYNTIYTLEINRTFSHQNVPLFGDVSVARSFFPKGIRSVEYTAPFFAVWPNSAFRVCMDGCVGVCVCATVFGPCPSFSFRLSHHYPCHPNPYPLPSTPSLITCPHGDLSAVPGSTGGAAAAKGPAFFSAVSAALVTQWHTRQDSG